MNIATLRRLKDEWQHRLGLGGWTIDIRFTSDTREVDDGCATVEYATSTRDAEIILLRHKFRSNKQLLLRRDYEVDLVHELTHLWLGRFETVKAGSERWVRQEQFIESNARALVGLKREAEKARKALESSQNRQGGPEQPGGSVGC